MTHDLPPGTEHAVLVLLDAALEFQSRDPDNTATATDGWFEQQARAQVRALLDHGWTPPVVSATTKELEGMIFDVLAGHCTDSEHALAAVIDAGWRPWTPHVQQAPPRWLDGDALDAALADKTQVGGHCEENQFYVHADDVRAILAALLPHYQGVAAPHAAPEPDPAPGRAAVTTPPRKESSHAHETE